MGVYTGAVLLIVMMGALVTANRIPALERYALERNAISDSLFMLLPVRFWKSPMKMFGAAMIAWTLFVVAYDVAGMVFQNLFDSVRHTPLMALSEGTVVYGVLSVLSWVGGMILHALRDSMRPGRKAASETTRHSQ